MGGGSHKSFLTRFSAIKYLFPYCRVIGHQSLASRGQPVGGTSPSSSTSSLATTSSSSSCSNLPRPTYNIPKANNVNGSQLQYQPQKSSQKIAKPISSVAPTNIVQKTTRSFIPTGDKPSPIYQTSSTKILPVQPQTLGSTPQVRNFINNSNKMVERYAR